MRVEQLRKHFEIETKWTAFLLHPEASEDGITFEELYAGRSAERQKNLLRFKKVADELGLPLGERKKTYNSRLAHELAKWAEVNGKGDLFHDAVFRAYFVDTKNISNVDELVSLAKSAGLPENEARSILESRTYKEAVDADWSRSHQLGITGVPTFVIGHQVTVGFQPYEALEQFLKSCGVVKRKD